MGTFVSRIAVDNSLRVLSPQQRASLPTEMEHELKRANLWLNYSIFVEYLRYFGDPDPRRATTLRAMGNNFMGVNTSPTLADALHTLPERYCELHRGHAGRLFVQQHSQREWQITAALRYPYPFIEGIVRTVLAAEPGLVCGIQAGTVTRNFASLLLTVQQGSAAALD
jgi:hypothetical protein